MAKQPKKFGAGPVKKMAGGGGGAAQSGQRAERGSGSANSVGASRSSSSSAGSKGSSVASKSTAAAAKSVAPTTSVRPAAKPAVAFRGGGLVGLWKGTKLGKLVTSAVAAKLGKSPTTPAATAVPAPTRVYTPPPAGYRPGIDPEWDYYQAAPAAMKRGGKVKPKGKK